MSSQSPHAYPVSALPLSPPPLNSLAPAISTALSSNFHVSSCSVVPCPDLSLPPYHLAGPTLCGSPAIADVGGPPFLAPSPRLDKRYDVLRIARDMHMREQGGVLIGAGAGAFWKLGGNAEGMVNVAWGTAVTGDAEVDASGEGLARLRNSTHYAKVKDDGSVLCQKVAADNTAFGLMCNLFGCDGVPGPVLHVRARGRKGSLNFTETIRKALADAFGGQLISLGGVFVVREGCTKLHVMPGFPDVAFRDRDEVDRWLRYYEVKAPLVCLSVLHSRDNEMKLRVEHTHCFGTGPGADSRGGHYHYDLDGGNDGEEVEYEGFFNVAERLYRIDQPDT